MYANIKEIWKVCGGKYNFKTDFVYPYHKIEFKKSRKEKT